MSIALSLQLGLDDLLAELHHARRRGDLGRLALLAYCDVRRWARQAGQADIARQSMAMFTEEPHASRGAFLDKVDALLRDLEALQSALPAPPPAHRPASMRAWNPSSKN